MDRSWARWVAVSEEVKVHPEEVRQVKVEPTQPQRLPQKRQLQRRKLITI